MNNPILKYALLGGFILIVFPLLIWYGYDWLVLFPIVLLFMYGVVYNSKFIFFSLILLTPLSINIEEYNSSFGLFIPTEPLLFSFLIFILSIQFFRPFIDYRIFRNPLFIAVSFYFLWLFITSITSSSAIISFKFLLARLWLIVPIIILGTIYFKESINVKRFFWFFSISLSLVIIYTIFNHAQYGFDEKSGHWVMNPFFKDHTIYGAVIALSLPFVIGLWVLENKNPLYRAIALLLFLILITGLVFSYSRAAWLSVLLGSALVLLVYFRVKFIFLFSSLLILLSVLMYNWDSLIMELERNKKEHTAKNIEERFESATNVSTDASNLERINRWDCAISMFKERPLVGFGPGTYAFEYARFQDPENLTIISTNFGNLGNAHSEYLGALSETGLIGLVFFSLMVILFFYKTISLFQKMPKEYYEIRVFLLVILFSITTYFSHAFLNNFLDTDKAGVPIWCMFSIIICIDLFKGSLSSNPK